MTDEQTQKCVELVRKLADAPCVLSLREYQNEAKTILAPPTVEDLKEAVVKAAIDWMSSGPAGHMSDCGAALIKAIDALLAATRDDAKSGGAK